jgi:hypothetical protein
MELCAEPSCDDSVLNGDETDVDCGGSVCDPCGASSQCATDSDCTSQMCSPNHTCIEATCTDGLKNQDETATDCGGTKCAGCGAGEPCNIAADCADDMCRSSLCVPAEPTTKAISRAKWRLSSSESTTESGLDQPFDGVLSTCWFSGKDQHADMWVEVDLGQPRVFFKALLQATDGPCTGDFPFKIDVYVSLDHEFGDPVKTDQVGDQYTWIQFPGGQVARYVRFVVTAPAPRVWGIGELWLYD